MNRVASEIAFSCTNLGGSNFCVGKSHKVNILEKTQMIDFYAINSNESISLCLGGGAVLY